MNETNPQIIQVLPDKVIVQFEMSKERLEVIVKAINECLLDDYDESENEFKHPELTLEELIGNHELLKFVMGEGLGWSTEFDDPSEAINGDCYSEWKQFRKK